MRLLFLVLFLSACAARVEVECVEGQRLTTVYWGDGRMTQSCGEPGVMG